MFFRIRAYLLWRRRGEQRPDNAPRSARGRPADTASGPIHSARTPREAWRDVAAGGPLAAGGLARTLPRAPLSCRSLTTPDHPQRSGHLEPRGRPPRSDVIVIYECYIFSPFSPHSRWFGLSKCSKSNSRDSCAPFTLKKQSKRLQRRRFTIDFRQREKNSHEKL